MTLDPKNLQHVRLFFSLFLLWENCCWMFWHGTIRNGRSDTCTNTFIHIIRRRCCAIEPFIVRKTFWTICAMSSIILPPSESIIICFIKINMPLNLIFSLFLFAGKCFAFPTGKPQHPLSWTKGGKLLIEIMGRRLWKGKLNTELRHTRLRCVSRPQRRVCSRVQFLHSNPNQRRHFSCQLANLEYLCLSISHGIFAFLPPTHCATVWAFQIETMKNKQSN